VAEWTSVVLLDMYENPVKVDTKELMESCSQERWQEQMNAWLIRTRRTKQK
jgi:hypothetical protein